MGKDPSYVWTNIGANNRIFTVKYGVQYFRKFSASHAMCSRIHVNTFRAKDAWISTVKNSPSQTLGYSQLKQSNTDARISTVKTVQHRRQDIHS